MSEQFVEKGRLSGCALGPNGRLISGMGIDAGDIDGTGRPSLFVTNFELQGNVLFRNRGALDFQEASDAAGVWGPSVHHLGFGAVFADVNTAYLPNWSRGLGHSIAIVGYDDTAGTYAYVDTCGRRCNGSSQSTNGGVWHIAQSRMYTAITSFGVGYAR